MKSDFSLEELLPLIQEVVESGGEFNFHPKGISMLPLIRQNTDSVVLSKAEFPLKKGDVALYRRQEGRYVLHRVVGIHNGTYTMCGDNQKVFEHGVKDGQIIAVMSDMYRKGKRVHIDKNIIYKIYCFVWSSFFIRKVVFKLKKIKNGIFKKRAG